MPTPAVTQSLAIKLKYSCRGLLKLVTNKNKYNMKVELDDLVTTKQVAKMLNYSVRNISHLVKSKKIKPIKTIEDKIFLFDIKDVNKYIESKNK
jgi:hypothetical protein